MRRHSRAKEFDAVRSVVVYEQKDSFGTVVQHLDIVIAKGDRRSWLKVTCRGRRRFEHGNRDNLGWHDEHSSSTAPQSDFADAPPPFADSDAMNAGGADSFEADSSEVKNGGAHEPPNDGAHGPQQTGHGRKDYDDLHTHSAGFVAVTAVIVALALPLLNGQASVWTRIGVVFALAGTIWNGVGFMIMSILARGEDPIWAPNQLWWGQLAVFAISVALIGLALVLLFVGQWGRHGAY